MPRLAAQQPFWKKAGALLSLSALACFGTPLAQACTRVVYSGDNQTVITGRSMDWYQDNKPSLWSMPRGMKRDGATGANTLRWTSKYGSVVVSMYDIGTVDGINDKGLVANTLYLAESNYGKAEGKPTLSIAAWAQYVLDSYGSVNEAVAALRKEPFRIVAPVLPGGRPAQGHLSISDPTGDSAIFEYIDGKLVIHHGKQYPVMTNSPTYDQQLALNTYWEQMDGLFLPGTASAADRFARASFMVKNIAKAPVPDLITAVPEQSFDFQAMASVLGVMRAVSSPLAIKDDPKVPNVSSTLWRTTYDHKNRILVFDSATAPSAFWVRLDAFNLSAGQPVKQLNASGGRTYSGDVSNQFVPAKPFAFLPGTPKN